MQMVNIAKMLEWKSGLMFPFTAAFCWIAVKGLDLSCLHIGII